MPAWAAYKHANPNAPFLGEDLIVTTMAIGEEDDGFF